MTENKLIENKLTLPRTFNKIILTLENCLLPESKLQLTPSQTDGMNRETEIDLRILGCELIQTAGILLRLPQVAMATGQVLFQRFFYVKSFVNHNMEITAMSCICLASKIEEAPRCFRDVINVFHHVKQVRAQKNITPVILDVSYISLKNQVIKAERSVLKILGFCVHVKHPHKLIVIYLQVLGYEKNQKLMQMAWNFMNDSLRTDVFVRHPPETIACACIYLTIRKLNIAFPMNPPWFGIFKVSENDIIDVSYRILELYRRAKPNAEKLEQVVIELKRKNAHAKEKSNINVKQMMAMATIKATTTTGTGTGITTGTGTGTIGTGTTTVDRNNGSHNAWGGFLSRTIPISDPAICPLSEVNNRMETQIKHHQHRQHHQHHHHHHHHQQQQQQQQQHRSKSKSPRSRTMSPIDINSQHERSRSRATKKRNKRSKTPTKYSKSSNNNNNNKSRYYSRSPSSSSPHAKHKKRSDHRDSKSEYYSNGGGDRNMIKERLSAGNGGSDRPRDRESGSGLGGDGDRGGGGGRARSKDRIREKDRSSGGKHDRYRNSHHRSSTKHRDRSRDRSRDRKR